MTAKVDVPRPARSGSTVVPAGSYVVRVVPSTSTVVLQGQNGTYRLAADLRSAKMRVEGVRARLHERDGGGWLLIAVVPPNGEYVVVLWPAGGPDVS
jgi:hypothetical protein